LSRLLQKRMGRDCSASTLGPASFNCGVCAASGGRARRALRMGPPALVRGGPRTAISEVLTVPRPAGSVSAPTRCRPQMRRWC